MQSLNRSLRLLSCLLLIASLLSGCAVTQRFEALVCLLFCVHVKVDTESKPGQPPAKEELGAEAPS
jgi:hypothetical protein